MVATKPTNIDHAKTYFQRPVPTRINGKSSFKSLRILYNEIKTNAGTVTENLGGDSLGYLGLLLSAAEYNRVAPGTPFMRPMIPGVLNILTAVTQHTATRIREDHAEELCIYRECLDVEASLKKCLKLPKTSTPSV